MKFETRDKQKEFFINARKILNISVGELYRRVKSVTKIPNSISVFYNWTCGRYTPPLEIIKSICKMTNQNLNDFNVKILPDYFWVKDAIKIRDQSILERKTEQLKDIFNRTEPAGKLVEMHCHLNFRRSGRRVAVPVYRDKFLAFCKRNNIRTVYTYVKNGKLYISKNQKGVPSNLFPLRHGVEITISRYFLPFMNVNGKDTVVVFEGFPKSVFKKKSKAEVSAKTIIRNRKIRSIFENNLVKRILNAGIPTAILEPRIEDFNGVPDLLLPNNIVVEFAGMRKDEYIDSLIKKIVKLSKKRKYKNIVVASSENYEILKERLKEVENVTLFREGEFIEWIKNYSKKLKALMKELNLKIS